AVTFYGLTLLAIRLLGSGLAEYARREHLYSPPKEGEEPPGAQQKLLSVVVGYVLAIIIGLLWPAVAVAVYFAIAVYLVVPFRQVARLLSRRSYLPARIWLFSELQDHRSRWGRLSIPLPRPPRR